MTSASRSITIATATAALLALTACGTQPAYQGGNTQGSQPAGTTTSGSNTANAQYGVVQSMDLVRQQGSGGVGTGAIVGAVVGGVLGNQVGKGDGRTAATVLGAAGGAYAGNEIQKRNQQSDAVQVNVRLYNGATVSVIQDSADDIRVGDRVVVQNGTARRY
jgi:outer membrane lipoprotein SlyB